jgi:type IX secretion system PorP/SprF family membrane protein
MKYFFTLLIITITTFAVFAQDAHYSMYQYAPLYLNPAYTGQSVNSNRLILNYRSQWMNIPPAYRNIGASFDRKRNNGGWGLLLNQNDAGAASLQQTNVYFNYALGRQLSDRHQIALGGQAGFTQKRFDAAAFSFDTQYSSANGFDATLNNGENFTRTSVLAPDFNIGFLYQFLPSESSKISGEGGFAFSHLNTPDISLTEGSMEDLPLKRLIHAKINYAVSNEFTISPRVLAINHYRANEVTFGVLGRYKISEKTALNFGIDIRQDEAFIFTGGIERNSFILAASFDATNSSLQTPVNNQGAVEVALIYLFDKFNKPKPKPFNQNGDRDGDGVLDNVDKCPDVSGLVRLEGCPNGSSNDKDGDGVLDNVDNCPDVAGLVRLQGCPENTSNDRDGDGIVNEKDKCPDAAGVFRLEGCPENSPSQPIAKDSDGDGVFDDIDLCPTTPGLPQYQGCNDYDKDGIFDNIDVCPKVYGDAANYGCPLNNNNLDSDGDGVLDKDDKCVYLRGKPSLNGCPDSDEDGISDILDDCPFLKGPAANSGCPVKNIQNNTPMTTMPTPLTNAAAEISIDLVEFDLDKSFIQPQYFEMLNRVANIMLQNPSYNILLVGHTDASGSAAYNYQLGQRRSMAIRDYLIRQGVSPNRFQIMSYGETTPKDSNINDSGRQRNRRTEIVIMDNFQLKYDTRN